VRRRYWPRCAERDRRWHVLIGSGSQAVDAEGNLPMHKDELKGAAKEAKGSVKQAAGKATGNERLEAEGAAEKTAGKVQKGVGNIKEAARDALKH